MFQSLYLIRVALYSLTVWVLSFFLIAWGDRRHTDKDGLFRVAKITGEDSGILWPVLLGALLLGVLLAATVKFVAIRHAVNISK